jgi:hypothetical protein
MFKPSLAAAFASLLCLLITSSPLLAADLTLKVPDKGPPNELGATIREQLQSKSVQLLEGDTVAAEFWLSAAIPLQSKPASLDKALGAVKQATLLGAISVAKGRRDYRDDDIAAGVYTMRFALQPQDGNHLGTSEFDYFAVLTPAKVDDKLDGIADYKALVKASRQETSTDHPVIISLRPASSEQGEFPSLNEPAPEHKSVRLKVPARIAGSEEKASLVFELVYEGKGKK